MTDRQPNRTEHHPVKVANGFLCAACMVRWPCRTAHQLIANPCADATSRDGLGSHGDVEPGAPVVELRPGERVSALPRTRGLLRRDGRRRHARDTAREPQQAPVIASPLQFALDPRGPQHAVID